MPKVQSTSGTNPFADLLKPYFGWLTSEFGDLAHEAIRHGVSAAAVAEDYLQSESRRDHFLALQAPAIARFVTSFWKKSHPQIKAELAKLGGMRARFGGDIGPQTGDHIFQSAGLYFDTIIVPDPLLKVTTVIEAASVNRGFYLLKYAISQQLMSQFYLAPVYPPIAVLTAEDELLAHPQPYRSLAALAQLDSVAVTNDLFGTQLESYDQTKAFYSRFGTLKALASAVTKPHLLWFDERAPRDIGEQIDILIRDGSKEIDQDRFGIVIDSPDYVHFALIGRMMQAGDLLAQASAERASPLVAAPVSFHWLRMKITLNDQLATTELGLSPLSGLSITNAMLSQPLSWLANVPEQSLIRLRESGMLADLRALIGRELQELSNLDIASIEAVTAQIDYNLSSALRKHQEVIRQLDSDLRANLAVSTPTLLLAVAGALQPSLAPLVPDVLRTVGLSVVGGTTLQSIARSVSAYLREKRRLAATPVGILWGARKAKAP